MIADGSATTETSRPGAGAPVVVVIGTLDTKGRDIAYVGANLRAAGVRPIVVDSGILGEPQEITGDVTRHEVARAAGSSLEAIRRASTRGAATALMAEGLTRVVVRLHGAGRCDGVLALGGASGAIMAARAMQALPLGVPKLIVTPVAAGRRPFGPLVGLRDVMVMHSVIDIGGLNPLSRAIFDTAGAAMVGMVRARAGKAVSWAGGRHVAVTMLGNTTPGVMRLEEGLRAAGFTPVIFHANGVGGPCMEALIREGAFVGVIDFTTNELTDELVGGYHAAGPDRLQAAAACGIPQVVVPGGVDFFVTGPEDSLRPAWRARPTYAHTPVLTLVRATAEEMVEVAQRMAARLNGARGAVAVAVPCRGLSIPNQPGGAFWDPETDRAFVAALRTSLRPDIPVIEVDAHVNDPAFAFVVLDLFHRLAVGAPSAVGTS